MINPEEVDYHSRLKHEFINIYLGFYQKNVAEKAKERKKSPPSLQIYDLYAAQGWCHSEEGELVGSSEGTWAGSALIAAKCIGEYSNSTRLFLNTYNPNPRKCAEQRTALEANSVEYYQRYTSLKSKTTIVSEPVEKAIEAALPGLSKSYPNVWILDPYDPLRWSVIDSIANQTGSYNSHGNQILRRPELIITLMSSVLQRFSEINPEITTATLGIPEEEWRPKFFEYKTEYGNAREAILRLYFDRLKALYGKDPVFTLVRDVTNRAIVYAMLLCSTNDAGHYLMKRMGLPSLDGFKVEIWKPTATRIVKKRKDPGQKFLDL